MKLRQLTRRLATYDLGSSLQGLEIDRNINMLLVFRAETRGIRHVSGALAMDGCGIASDNRAGPADRLTARNLVLAIKTGVMARRSDGFGWFPVDADGIPRIFRRIEWGGRQVQSTDARLGRIW
jgi:hypothetical protein